ncbi:MAG: hypothetical protein ACRDNF_01715 [Streptosporangiaceae bacterium]
MTPGWQTSDGSPEAMASAFDAYADVLTPAIAGHWGYGPGRPHA